MHQGFEGYNQEDVVMPNGNLEFKTIDEVVTAVKQC